MTIKYEWTFHRVGMADRGDRPDFIFEFTGELHATDTVTGNTASDSFPCSYEMPEGESFIEFADITPAVLREWLIAYHGSNERGAWPHGPEAWLQRRKDVLAKRLEERANVRRPTIIGTAIEPESSEVTP